MMVCGIFLARRRIRYTSIAKKCRTAHLSQSALLFSHFFAEFGLMSEISFFGNIGIAL